MEEERANLDQRRCAHEVSVVYMCHTYEDLTAEIEYFERLGEGFSFRQEYLTSG
jgi:hypothetical protein